MSLYCLAGEYFAKCDDCDAKVPWGNCTWVALGKRLEEQGWIVHEPPYIQNKVHMCPECRIKFNPKSQKIETLPARYENK